MKLPKNIFTIAGLVDLIARSTSGYNPTTMQGACFGCSTALAAVINVLGYGRAEIEVYGAAHRAHAWTRVSFGAHRPLKTAVIDLTFTQYDFDAPHVYVVDRRAKAFDTYLRNVSGASHEEAVSHVVAGASARIWLRQAGIDTSKFDYIAKKFEGLA